MTDIVLVFTAVLATSAIGAAAIYCRVLQKAKKEYKEAKEAVEDIVVSFNRQLRHEAGKMEVLAYRLEALASKTERASTKAEGAETAVRTIGGAFAVVKADNERGLARFEESNRNVCDAIAAQTKLHERISNLEKKARELSIPPEANIEAAIPIRRDKALAPLTETEIAVLEMLSAEGSKTAPEIKDRIRLSREHTARLMKKLYESGYLERETNKIPFRYNVKKEMEELLNKAKSQSQ